MKIKRINNIEFIWSELNEQYEIIQYCGDSNIAIAVVEYGRDKRTYPDLRTIGDHPFDDEVNWEDFGVLAKFALDYAKLMGMIDHYIEDKEFHNARY